MQKKVYCKNCKWRGSIWAHLFDSTGYVYILCKLYPEVYEHEHDKNYVGDCSDYQRQWWRVWV